MATERTTDVIVTNHGSIFSFQPLTQAAKDWFEENVQIEDYQRLGGSICVEHRYARDLAQGIIDAGLEVV